MKTKLLQSLLVIVLPVIVIAQGEYKKPPKEIMDVLNASPIPSVSVSPMRDRLALLEPLRYPPISELAQPMLRIAGLRINPNTNGQHRQSYAVSLRLRSVENGKEIVASLPAGAQIIEPAWSPDGKYIALGNVTPGGVELWFVDSANRKKSPRCKNNQLSGFNLVDGQYNYNCWIW